jgi:hypothetical protein
MFCSSAVGLSGCAAAPSGEAAFGKASSQPPKGDPAWLKYTVAGSRIPRSLDAHGQPNAAQPIVTITDRQLQQASGMLLGEKLGNGYSR